MKIDEAIKRLRARVDGEFSASDPENIDDMKLGIKALERIRELRALVPQMPLPPLPGETKD